MQRVFSNGYQPKPLNRRSKLKKSWVRKKGYIKRPLKVETKMY
jgi:hypothetical protein